MAGPMTYVYGIIGVVSGTEMAMHPAEHGKVGLTQTSPFNLALQIMIGSLIVVISLTILGYKLAKAIKGFRRR